MFEEDTTTSDLERRMAKALGHEAGLFVLSGTMANQIALRTHLMQPPHAILCDSHSHILGYEAGGVASASGAMVQAAVPTNGYWLSLEDIQATAVLTDDVHKCPTSVISLENTIAGAIHPIHELRRISNWARVQDLKLHLDGARLWEAVAANAGSSCLKDYGLLFDSVAIDFSKNLGAPMGAVIVGSAAFIKRARRIRKSIGGGMRQAGVLSAACNAAVDEIFELDQPGEGRLLREVHALAMTAGDMWLSRGGKLLKNPETNMVWLDLESEGVTKAVFNAVGKGLGVRLDGGRLVLHHQISLHAVQRLDKVFEDVLVRKAKL